MFPLTQKNNNKRIRKTKFEKYNINLVLHAFSIYEYKKNKIEDNIVINVPIIHMTKYSGRHR